MHATLLKLETLGRKQKEWEFPNNLPWAPPLSKSNGDPTIATPQLRNSLIPEERVWVSVDALIKSERPVFWNEYAGYFHHC